MMKFKFLAIASVAFLGMTAMTSCSKDVEFKGSWKAMSTEDATSQFLGASSATSQLLITFEQGEDASAGKVSLENEYTVTSPIAAEGLAVPVSFSVKGKAVADGTWTPDVDDSDDLLLDLNPASVKVDIPANSVTVSGVLPSDMSQERVDSLKAVFVEKSRQEMHGAMSAYVASMRVVSDVEVSNNRKSLEFDVDSKNRELKFEKVAE